MTDHLDSYLLEAYNCVGSTNNSKITQIRYSFVELNIFLILILSNRGVVLVGFKALVCVPFLLGFMYRLQSK